MDSTSKRGEFLRQVTLQQQTFNYMPLSELPFLISDRSLKASKVSKPHFRDKNGDL